VSAEVETIDRWEDEESGATYTLHGDLLYSCRPEAGGQSWKMQVVMAVPRRHAGLVQLLAAERLSNGELVRQVVRQAEEIADTRRQLAEHKGIWREAVRALLREGRSDRRVLPTRDEANAELCAKSDEQRIVLVPPADADPQTVPCPWLRVARGSRKEAEYRAAGWTEWGLPGLPGDWQREDGAAENENLRATLSELSRLGERFGWQGVEPLAEWLEAALTWHKPGEEIKRTAIAHGYDPAGPQRLIDWLAQQLDNLRLVTSAEAIEVRERTARENRQLQADLAEMRESWTSANRREEQTSRALSMLKLRVGRDGAAGAEGGMMSKVLIDQVVQALAGWHGADVRPGRVSRRRPMTGAERRIR
jgi:hypothetical protein